MGSRLAIGNQPWTDYDAFANGLAAAATDSTAGLFPCGYVGLRRKLTQRTGIAPHGGL